MANKRIFWAVQAVAIAVHGYGQSALLSTSHIIRGLQSAGITSTFNLEQVFEMGQLSLYENIQEIPDVEVTLEKVLDDDKLIYLMAAPKASTSIAKGSNDRCDVYLGIWADTADYAGSGQPQAAVYCSGMYVSSVSYTMPVDGNCTEAVTLVGNDKVWNSGDNFGVQTFGFDVAGGPDEDSPGTAGVQRRENVSISTSTIPKPVDNAGHANEGGIQSITISTDLGREEIRELGAFGPYHRYVTFPVEVTSEFEVIAASGDLVDVSSAAPTTVDQTIVIKLADGTEFNLGAKNKLASASYTGGDTGGGNVSVTYSYSNFNDLSLTSPA
jgi:hypothetical protein